MPSSHAYQRRYLGCQSVPPARQLGATHTRACRANTRPTRLADQQITALTMTGAQSTRRDNDRSEISPYGYAYRNCTDYVAWKLADLGAPASIYRGHGNGAGWASVAGLVTDTTPSIGAVAVQTSGKFGHVAFITGVSGSTVTVSEYNYGENGTYDSRSGTLSGLGFNKVTHFESYETGGGSSITTLGAVDSSGTFWAKSGIQRRLGGRVG